MSTKLIQIVLEDPDYWDEDGDDTETTTTITQHSLDEMMVGNRGHLHMDFYWPEYNRDEERRLQQKYPDYGSWVEYYFLRGRGFPHEEQLSPAAKQLWVHITNLVPREGVILCERSPEGCNCDGCRKRDPDTIYCVIYNQVLDTDSAENK